MFARPALVLACLCAAAPATAADADVLFAGARVLTMGPAGTLERAFVTVSDGRIVRVAATPPPAADELRRIEADGLVLMPGLADMHVHYFSENEGPMFLANSVTSVRNLWGSAQTLILDAKAASGTTPGPHVYTSGPLMDGPEPIWGDGSLKLTSPEQAVGAVESQRTTGYRAVKLYEGLTPEIYRAAVAAAQERDMQVWTHVPGGLDVEAVIELGVDSIEHFDDVQDSVLGDGHDPADGSYFGRWASADEARLAALARKSAEAGVWHSPTLTVIATRYAYGADAEGYFARPEAAYLGPGIEGWWRNSASRMSPWDERKRKAAAMQRRFLALLHEAGAPLLLGTDTPNPFVLPGFAIHDELANFVEAGIPVAEVLRIATADAARFLREEGEWGVVREGARADLVLLDADPREDLATLRRPRGVMVNGHWYDAARLESELAALRARRAAEAEAAEAEAGAAPAG